jgi:DNA modification methylase
MHTLHKVIHAPARNLKDLANNSIDLVITSPPYPMVEMWDHILGQQNEEIEEALKAGNDHHAFELMHRELDAAWQELHRVVKPGGIVCINIGDATRSVNGEFRLYSNHSRIIRWFTENGFRNLPNIIWRKSTNAPNKFMGSGMLPAGAYVTLEHEHVLIFRKGEKRKFVTGEEKLNRHRSAFFWEERNIWFSDLWELKGAPQKLDGQGSRERSAAFPFEVPYRLINMFSVKGDTILDPFLGTGTTSLAAMAAARNSVGYEIDETLLSDFLLRIQKEVTTATLNRIISDRLSNHIAFVQQRRNAKGAGAFLHTNGPYGFPVMTSQERELMLNYVQLINTTGNSIHARYVEEAVMNPPARKLAKA